MTDITDRSAMPPVNDEATIKRSLFIDCTKVAILLLVYRGLTTLMSDLFYELTYVVLHGTPADMQTVLETLSTEHKDLVFTTFYSMLMNSSVTVASLLITLVIGRLLKFSFRGYLKPKAKDIKHGFYWAPACFMLNIVFSLAVNAFTSAMGSIGVNIPEANFTIRKPSVGAVLFQFLYIVVIAPLIEELIYRGMILGSLNKYGQAPAVFMSALCFGLMHGNIPQAASAFGTGLVFALLASECGSIYPSLVIHMINNFLINLSEFGSSLELKWINSLSSAMQIILGIVGAYILMTRYSSLRCDKEQSLSRPHEVIKKILTNPMMLLYLVYLLWEIVMGIINSNLQH